jgi:hypothetical protein
MAELYLTDLCFDEDAEMKCERFISLALEQDPLNLDGHQAMASLRLSQNRVVDAAPIMLEIFRQTMQQRAIYNQRTIVQDLLQPENEGEGNDIPTMEFSIQTAKLLVECGRVRPELNASAVELLSDLLEDEDEVIEIWYIIGVAALGLDPPDFELARHHLEHAREMLRVVHEQIGPDAFPFGDQLQLVEDHLQLLATGEQKQLGDTSMQQVIGDGNLEEANEDEEWSDNEEG